MICLGLESTAHTFGVGICDEKRILANARDVYRPEKGGIHPMEAANHHNDTKEKVLEDALIEANLKIDDINIFAYSAGPGLPPCLRVGSEFVTKIAGKKPIIEVNHCIAHIEIGKFATKVNDPIVIYVSGGNTQIIGYAANRYRVFGETQDISVGNVIDSVIRDSVGGFPGGPIFDELAKKGSYVELPYVVKGMDVSFTGILTAAKKKYSEGVKIEDICYSLQETCYAMLVEVTERALAHAGKSEVLVVGGVAASQRLKEMLDIMCSERGAHFFAVPIEYARDNAAMISFTGLLAYKSGQKPTEKPDFNPRWRTDEAEILWI